MPAATRRFLLVSLSALTYVGAALAFCLVERPGVGLGHLFYLPILLLAIATGPVIGAAGGVLGTVLYTVGIFVNPHIPSTLQWLQMLIRLVMFVSVGALVGWFARDNRRLVRDLERLANRDALTGLPNTRSFELAIDRRLEARQAFVLFVGDIDHLDQENVKGREHGDATLRRLADGLWAAKSPNEEVARLGGDEFAVISGSDVDPRSRASELERTFSHAGISVTFGWSSYPRDAASALGLYRAAEERMYARKVARGLRPGGLHEPRASRVVA